MGNKKAGPWWRNCALLADAEIEFLNSMEKRLIPLSPGVLQVRELISSLEICHHKAEAWIKNIITGIGEGRSSKGPGTGRQRHPVEGEWFRISRVLYSWCLGCPSERVPGEWAGIALKELLACAGERTP